MKKLLLFLCLLINALSIKAQVLLDMPDFKQVDPYTVWDETRAHPYSSEDVPLFFIIDLTNWTMPTDHRLVTSHFGWRAHFNRMHKGVDVKLYIGDTVRSAWAGKVRVVKYDPKGYGNYVVVRHNNGLETIYGHLSKHLVKPNQVIESGEPIGLGGNTGRSTGSHLHFETRIVGYAINPELMFDFTNQTVLGNIFVFNKSEC